MPSYCHIENVHDQFSLQTTTLFKEGTYVSEDTDYTFLHKVFLGKGTFGDAWRAWFYSPVWQREADIVVKEVRRLFKFACVSLKV